MKELEWRNLTRATSRVIAYDKYLMTEAKAQVIVAEMEDGLNLPRVAHSDFVTLMIKLYGSTKEIGGELIHIGRILIAKFMNPSRKILK